MTNARYPITTQRQIRKIFWQEHPNLDRKKITNYSGDGKMYRTDTRTAFVDFLQYLRSMNQISSELAQRAIL